MHNKLHTEETKRKISIARKGRMPMLGHHHTKEAKQKMSEAKRGNKSHWFGGKKHSIEAKGKMSEIAKKRQGEKSPNWKGGISKEPYSQDWTKELKKEIRVRDNYTCQLCGSKKNLVPHHINYRKDDCRKENLITLCISCNSKVNAMRDFWKGFFAGKIYERGKQLGFW